MKFKAYFFSAMITFGLIYLNACNKDKEAEGLDKTLFEMAQETNGFTWYKNSDALLDKSSGSGHPQQKLRTRFNATASEMLTPNGKVMENASFSDGSLIVKELYSTGGTFERYAILYKSYDNEFADDRGWVWGYINADGTVSATAQDRGSACISCHLQEGNIDYMLMNLYFP